MHEVCPKCSICTYFCRYVFYCSTQTPHRVRVAPSNGPVVPSQTRQQELAVPGDHQEGRPAAQQSAEAVQSHQHVSRGPGPAATYANLSFVSRFLFYRVYNKKRLFTCGGSVTFFHCQRRGGDLV